MQYLLTVCLVTLVAESYVICIGCVMPDEKSAAVVAPVRAILHDTSAIQPHEHPMLSAFISHRRLSLSLSHQVILALMMASGGFFVNAASVPALFRAINLVNPFKYAFAGERRTLGRTLRRTRCDTCTPIMVQHRPLEPHRPKRGNLTVASGARARYSDTWQVSCALSSDTWQVLSRTR